MPLFYISFARSKKEGGFLGATVVEAPDAESAVVVATMRGINPGGDAAILPLPPDALLSEPKALSMLNRLVGREEMLANGAVRRSDLPKKQRAQFDDWALYVCSCCNPPRVH